MFQETTQRTQQLPARSIAPLTTPSTLPLNKVGSNAISDNKDPLRIEHRRGTIPQD